MGLQYDAEHSPPCMLKRVLSLSLLDGIYEEEGWTG